MITKIQKTSKRIFKDGRWMNLYVLTAEGGTKFFRYAFSDKEAHTKYMPASIIIQAPIIVNASLDILLNSELIITN